jgi:hypothetical protein
MKIFRKTNDKPRCNAVYNEAKENAIDPKDKATLEDLKRQLAKAADDMDDHEGAPKYEAAFKAAQKQYDDFMDKIATKTNAKVRVFRKR